MKLSDVLNMIKDFCCGYTTACKNKMLIDYNGDRYVVTISKVQTPSTDMFEDIDKYLN